MELPGKGLTVYLIFSLQRLSIQVESKTYLKHAWEIKCSFVCKTFFKLSSSTSLINGSLYFTFSNTVSLIFGRVDGNVTISLNICFFKVIFLCLTQVHIFCISDNYKCLHCEEGPYKYEHSNLKYINLQGC